MRVLLVVDVQNDFLPGGALAVKEGDKVVPIINRLQKSFDHVIATQDWHPAGHRSFASQYPGKQVGDIIELNGLAQILWPDHCVQRTPGSDFAATLDRSRFETVIVKGTDPQIDSYSAFFDNARRKETGLQKYLRENNLTDVFVAGLATDYCVKFTALDARQLGFSTTVILDACRGVNLKPTDVDESIKEMRDAGIHTLESNQIL